MVVGKTYDLLLWLLPKVEKFPRSFRFSVGDRLVSHLEFGHLSRLNPVNDGARLFAR